MHTPGPKRMISIGDTVIFMSSDGSMVVPNAAIVTRVWEPGGVDPDVSLAVFYADGEGVTRFKKVPHSDHTEPGHWRRRPE